MDRYVINITEEQHNKTISKFTSKEQELIKEMAKEFTKLLNEIEDKERSKNERFFNKNTKTDSNI
jgi:hypothetical protein